MLKKPTLFRFLLLPFMLSGMLCTVPALAQSQPVHLKLQQAIDSAWKNNNAALLSELEEAISRSRYKETDAIFLPQLDFSFSAVATNNALNAFGLTLQQQLVKASDFNPDLLNHPGNTADFQSRFQLRQPILNMNLQYQRKAALMQTAVNKLQTERVKEFLTFETTRAYLQLQLAYDAAGVLEEALQTARALYRFTGDRVQEGLLQQSDLLNVKVKVTTVETQLAIANSNIQNASDYLSLLMGVPAGDVYTVEDFQFADTVETALVPTDRADFSAMKKAIEATNLMIRADKMSYLPRLNAVASWQTNDNRLPGFGANSYLAGLQLSWDIFKGNSTRNKLATQSLEQNRLKLQLTGQMQQSQVELNKTNRDRADAAFRIQQQKTAVEAAREALRILQDRYEQGLVNSTDVLLAQTQLAQEQLNLASAKFDQNLSRARLIYLTTHKK